MKFQFMQNDKLLIYFINMSQASEETDTITFNC